MAKKKPISISHLGIKLPTELRDKCRAEAARHRWRTSEFVRWALEMAVAGKIVVDHRDALE